MVSVTRNSTARGPFVQPIFVSFHYVRLLMRRGERERLRSLELRRMPGTRLGGRAPGGRAGSGCGPRSPPGPVRGLRLSCRQRAQGVPQFHFCRFRSQSCRTLGVCSQTLWEPKVTVPFTSSPQKEGLDRRVAPGHAVEPGPGLCLSVCLSGEPLRVSEPPPLPHRRRWGAVFGVHLVSGRHRGKRAASEAEDSPGAMRGIEPAPS